MSAPAAWRLTEVADLNGDRLLIVAGELDIATTPELARMLDGLRAHGHAVVLDLSGVTFMDSTGLNALIDARREAQRERWQFTIRRPSSAVRRVALLAGLDGMLV